MFFFQRPVDSLLKHYGLSEDDVVHCDPDAENAKNVQTLNWQEVRPIACLSEFKSEDDGRASLVVHGIYASESIDQNHRCIEKDSCDELPTVNEKRTYCIDPQGVYQLPEAHSEVYLNRVKISEDELTDDLGVLIRKYVRKKCDGKSSIVYGLAGISASVFHGIADQKLPEDYGRDIADKIRKPEKETLFRLGIVLQLNIEEMRELLATADHAFSPCRIRDKVVETCFLERILDHDEVNWALFRNKCQKMEFGDYTRLERRN